MQRLCAYYWVDGVLWREQENYTWKQMHWNLRTMLHDSNSCPAICMHYMRRLLCLGRNDVGLSRFNGQVA